MKKEDVNQEHGFFDRPKNKKIMFWSFVALLVLLLLLDFVSHKHSYFYLDGFPGFYAVYGFGAYVLLVVVAQLLRKLLERGEDYYE